MIRSLIFLLAMPGVHAVDWHASRTRRSCEPIVLDDGAIEDAGEASSIRRSCEQFIVDGGNIKEVCGSHEFRDAFVVVNDSYIPYGDHVHTYKISELDLSMVEVMPSNNTDDFNGLVVEVIRSFDGGL